MDKWYAYGGGEAVENVVLEGLWTGIGSMLSNAWPILALLLILNLAKPLLKKRRKRKNRRHRQLGFFERIMTAVNGAPAPANTQACNGPAEVFKAGDVLSDLPEKPKNSDRNYSEELMDQGDAYIARTHLMSPTERDVFKVLEKAYGDKYYIFCQVRVVDLIQPNVDKYHSKSKEFLSLFRQLSQWHFDYVLCDKSDFRIFCVLELDDPSHERGDRVKRDRILNNACRLAELRLERLKINHSKRKVEVIVDVAGA